MQHSAGVSCRDKGENKGVGGTTSRIGSEFYDGQADRGGQTGTAVSCLQTTL